MTSSAAELVGRGVPTATVAAQRLDYWDAHGLMHASLSCAGGGAAPVSITAAQLTQPSFCGSCAVTVDDVPDPDVRALLLVAAPLLGRRDRFRAFAGDLAGSVPDLAAIGETIEALAGDAERDWSGDVPAALEDLADAGTAAVTSARRLVEGWLERFRTGSFFDRALAWDLVPVEEIGVATGLMSYATHAPAFLADRVDDRSVDLRTLHRIWHRWSKELLGAPTRQGRLAREPLRSYAFGDLFPSRARRRRDAAIRAILDSELGRVGAGAAGALAAHWQDVSGAAPADMAPDARWVVALSDRVRSHDTSVDRRVSVICALWEAVENASSATAMVVVPAPVAAWLVLGPHLRGRIGACCCGPALDTDRGDVLVLAASSWDGTGTELTAYRALAAARDVFAPPGAEEVPPAA